MSPVPSMWWTAGCRCDPRASLAYLGPYPGFWYARQKCRRSVVSPDTQGVVMTFREVLAQVVAWLQQDKRVSYGALKRQFALDDAALADLQDAILYAYPQVGHEADRGLVWTPAAPAVAAEAAGRIVFLPPLEREALPAIAHDPTPRQLLHEHPGVEGKRRAVRPIDGPGGAVPLNIPHQMKGHRLRIDAREHERERVGFALSRDWERSPFDAPPRLSRTPADEPDESRVGRRPLDRCA